MKSKRQWLVDSIFYLFLNLFGDGFFIVGIVIYVCFDGAEYSFHQCRLHKIIILKRFSICFYFDSLYFQKLKYLIFSGRDRIFFGWSNVFDYVFVDSIYYSTSIIFSRIFHLCKKLFCLSFSRSSVILGISVFELLDSEVLGIDVIHFMEKTTCCIRINQYL